MLTIIETPYADTVGKPHSHYPGASHDTIEYALACLKESLLRGESPVASHLLYTQVLDDTNDHQRRVGIRAGLRWKLIPDAVTVFYLDKGCSFGMWQAMQMCQDIGSEFELRYLEAP